MTRMHAASVGIVLSALSVALIGCSVGRQSIPQSQPPVARYVVTATPIDIGIAFQACIAVDPTDPQGVWWWRPVESDCSRRSTGPGVIHAEHAAVSPPARSGAIEARFRVQLHGRPGSTLPAFADVQLVLDDGGMRAIQTGARVPTRRRTDLDIPGWPR